MMECSSGHRRNSSEDDHGCPTHSPSRHSIHSILQYKHSPTRTPEQFRRHDSKLLHGSFLDDDNPDRFIKNEERIVENVSNFVKDGSDDIRDTDLPLLDMKVLGQPDPGQKKIRQHTFHGQHLHTRNEHSGQADTSLYYPNLEKSFIQSPYKTQKHDRKGQIKRICGLPGHEEIPFENNPFSKDLITAHRNETKPLTSVFSLQKYLKGKDAPFTDTRFERHHEKDCDLSKLSYKARDVLRKARKTTMIEEGISTIAQADSSVDFHNCGVPTTSALPQPDDKSIKFRVSESDSENLTLVQSGVTLTLLNSSLWKAFNHIGTEMIINRGGRRMFPYLSLSVKGLIPTAQYTVSVQIMPASPRRCKFINSNWVPMGLADSEPPQLPYFHLDSPSSGQHWNRTKIYFTKIKLTNNKDSTPHNILLHSMHKYRIVTTFTRIDPSDDQTANPTLSFYFPETDFIAVTAYQNESVTQMKIHNNPFAKAFRDANFTEIRKSIASRKRKQTSVSKAEESSSLSRIESSMTSSSTSNDGVVCTVVSPVALPITVNSTYPWTPFNTSGCMVPQYQDFGYCLPWGRLSGYHRLIYPSLLPVGSPNLTDSALTTFGTGHHFLMGNQNQVDAGKIQSLQEEACVKKEEGE